MLLLSSPLLAAPAFDHLAGSYFCVEEGGGGLTYDGQLKKWIGTIFRVDNKFILTLTFQSTKDDPAYPNSIGTAYETTITPSGSSEPQLCWEPSTFVSPTVYKNPALLLNCSTLFIDYRFSFLSNRYLRVYDSGFIDGKDNNDNTPGIFGGTCTKIK